MRTTTPGVVLTAFFLCSAISLVGQASPTAAVTQAPDPDAGISGHVEGLFIPRVAGHPFHAKIPVQIIRHCPTAPRSRKNLHAGSAR